MIRKITAKRRKATRTELVSWFKAAAEPDHCCCLQRGLLTLLKSNMALTVIPGDTEEHCCWDSVVYRIPCECIKVYNGRKPFKSGYIRENQRVRQGSTAHPCLNPASSLSFLTRPWDRPLPLLELLGTLTDFPVDSKRPSIHLHV